MDMKPAPNFAARWKLALAAGAPVAGYQKWHSEGLDGARLDAYTIVVEVTVPSNVTSSPRVRPFVISKDFLETACAL